jgi:phosphohistidine phosphatase
MKTLYVIRHAKSSWDDPSLPDFERPLNKRGRRDAPFMARIIADILKKPDVLITSPAKRALETALAFCNGFNISEDMLVEDRTLYHPSIEDILRVVHKIDEAHGIAAIFGHNPGFTSFVNTIGKASIMNVPTTGVVVLTSEAQFWANFEDEKVKTVGFHYPKQYL